MAMPEFVSSSIYDWPEAQRDFTAGSFDANYVPYGIFCDNYKYGNQQQEGASANKSGIFFGLAASQTDYWVHWEHYHTGYNSGSDGYLEDIWDENGNLLFRIELNNGATALQLYAATTETTGYVNPIPNSGRRTIDLHFQYAAGNVTLDIYINKKAVDFGTPSYTLGPVGDAGKLHPAYMRNIANDTNTGATVSQIMASTTSTLGKKVVMKLPTGNSATNADQTYGGYQQVSNKWRSSALQLAANGDRAGFTLGGVNLAGTLTGIDGVRIRGRALAGATGPQNIKPSLRINSINYDGTNKLLTQRSYDWFETDWLTDPDKAAAWLETDIETSGYLEPGIVALT